jgi:hypothetical protein
VAVVLPFDGGVDVDAGLERSLAAVGAGGGGRQQRGVVRGRCSQGS